eukprot:NODE_3561_length_953_cov_30.355088_g3271_i0.p1 GENE.NODE_3561_length_953_cov_30.355088_g3271_i0~~NODE_3561_length_953_cov_30.355088_g3271_i0.p1  ORF type:complete len:212 (+),score=19.42 NODE_3561_length_953_cov_30.355088_g3271_i0:139-774(+)
MEPAPSAFVWFSIHRRRVRSARPVVNTYRRREVYEEQQVQRESMASTRGDLPRSCSRLDAMQDRWMEILSRRQREGEQRRRQQQQALACENVRSRHHLEETKPVMPRSMWAHHAEKVARLQRMLHDQRGRRWGGWGRSRCAVHPAPAPVPATCLTDVVLPGGMREFWVLSQDGPGLTRASPSLRLREDATHPTRWEYSPRISASSHWGYER